MRANQIPESKQELLYAYVFGIAKNLELEILALGGTANHVHILLALPPKRTLSDVVRDLKANSSRWMRTECKHFSWQEGFGAFSVSLSQTSIVKDYIRNQAIHHRKRKFEEEFIALLEKSGIPYNPKYVFG